MKHGFFAAAAVALTIGAANASPINVTLQDPNNAFGAPNLKQAVKVGSENPGLGLHSGLVYAGEFQLTGDNGFGDFGAFCIDLVQYLGGGGSFVEMPNLLTASVVDKIDRLYTSAYAMVTDSLNAAAFQVALWEIVYDDETPGGFNLDSGNFLTALKSNSTEEYNPAVEAKAESFLAGLAGAGTGAYQLTFLQSDQSQDLVTATPAPVPLPAAGWMLIAGMGGLVALRRRNKPATA